MKITAINAGYFYCDAGAIFGSVPKVLWSKQVSTNNLNLIKIPMRCLLIQDGTKNILIETGAGSKHSEKFIRNNGMVSDDVLIQSLQNIDVLPSEITDVILTHLHWDHAGGCTKYNQNGQLELTFTNATHHCSKAQWQNAHAPNIRENDAYFPIDFDLLETKNKLHLIEENGFLFDSIEIRQFNGHTYGQLIPIIHYENRQLVYVSDFVPLTSHIRLKWVAAYDLFPVTTMEEKALFLKEISDQKMTLFFEHDDQTECCNLRWDENKGSILNETFSLVEYLRH